MSPVWSRLRYRIAALVCVSVLMGCSPSEEPFSTPDYAALHTDWQALLAGRDSLFRSEASPLLPTDRASFEGLAYFAYDSTLAFHARVSPELARDTFVMATSTGEVRPFIRYGVFRFQGDDRAYTLTAFKPVDEPGARLFIPFQDLTSGQTTYGGGRYLDIDEAPDGLYTIDFNQAYHPYCVYNPIYSCPIPPPENRLGLAVTAGERLQGS